MLHNLSNIVVDIANDAVPTRVLCQKLLAQNREYGMVPKNK